ncbi:hypothetical protein MRB53_036895 [Persea americana]|nr:hypothetical protein MRB53_036895 [Persea americana]
MHGGWRRIPRLRSSTTPLGVEILGEDKERGLMTGMKIKNVKTGQVETIPANGLFYAVGHEPATLALQGPAEDGRGRISHHGAGQHEDERRGCLRGRRSLEAEKWLAENEAEVPNGVEATEVKKSQAQQCGARIQAESTAVNMNRSLEPKSVQSTQR